MDKISVIIPVYNVEKYLRQCLDSVINQTYKNLEIICIDDCSTDNSFQILKEYEKIDDRIKIYQNDCNKGPGLTRNFGIDVATGKYVHFLDSDDWLELNTYEYLANYTSGVEVLFFYIQQISNKDNKKKNWTHFFKNQPKNICNIKTNPEIIDNWIRYVYNKLYLKSFLDMNNIRFNNYPCFEDHNFSLEVLLKANKIYFVDKILYNYRIDNYTSITSKFYDYKEYAYKSYIMAVKLFEPFNEDLKKHLIINEFAKYFQVLEGIYDIGKINYEQFRYELQKINISNYDNTILNSRKFIQYKEILNEPEFSYKTKRAIRDFTRTYCPFIHRCLTGLRKHLRGNMKQKIFKIIAIFLIFSLLFGCYFKIQDNARYKINSPMQDIEYKKKIIKSSKDKSYTLENMRPIVGPQELLQFIAENDNNPQIYTPSDENIKNGIFSANLHMHTLYSDGQMTIRQLLDKAQGYAKDFPDGKYMYVAITDHNTILGTQNLIFTLQKNPNRYTKIKVVPGIEIFTKFNSKYSNKLIDIHVLTWCINPYDKFLEKEFYKADLSDRYNYKYRDFDEVIRIMKNYGIVGVAHPARYVSYLKKDKYAYIEEMLGRLKQTSENVFTEGYYQTYPVLPDKEELGNEYEDFLEHINKTAKNYDIIRTGSTDTHGYSIFRK